MEVIIPVRMWQFVSSCPTYATHECILTSTASGLLQTFFKTKQACSKRNLYPHWCQNTNTITLDYILSPGYLFCIHALDNELGYSACETKILIASFKRTV